MTPTTPGAIPTADLAATGDNSSAPAAALSGSGRRRRPTVEFRIHGIGNQLPWHALGEPRTIPALARDEADDIPTDSADPVGNQPDRFILSFSPPEHTRNLWLINWARTSRRTARFSWFLAIPFTMVNVAGHMGPEDKDAPGRRLLPFAVHVVAGLMSVSIVIWLAVLVETVLKHAGGWQPWVVVVRVVATAAVVGAWSALRGHWPISRSLAAVVALWSVWLYTWPFDVGRALPWQPTAWSKVYWFVVAVTGLGVTVGIWGRWKYGVTKAPLGTVASHSVVTLLVTLVLLTRPVRWTPPDWLPSWATVPPPAQAACDTARHFEPGWVCGPRVDTVMTVVVLSLATAVALAGLLLVAHARTPSLGRTPNLAGAALLLVLGPLLLHTVASVSRVTLDWLLRYVDHLVSYVSPRTAWPNPIAFRLVTPTDVQGRFVYGIDIVVLLMVAFLVATTLTGFLVGRAHLEATAPPDGASLPHRIVQGLPTTLAPTLGFGLIGFVLIAVGLATATDESPPLPAWAALLVALLVQATALFVALLYAGRLARARDVLSRIADVAGFWPVIHHPLAGSSYRPHVLRGIVHEINRSGAARAVVIGHSQGSVLAACVVGGLYEAPPLKPTDVRLLTCGCPLTSLYAAFFPAEFNATSFAMVRAGAAQNWVNCWRASDGIASEVPANINEQLPDPREENARPRGHGDYWTDTDQVQIAGVWSQSVVGP